MSDTTIVSGEKPEVVNLGEMEASQGSRGFWRDAWRRLSRNYFALIGILVVGLNVVMAILAPYIAPQHYATQFRDDNNSAPAWVIRLFPTMHPLDEEVWRFEGEEGQVVSLAMISPDFDAQMVLMDSNGNWIKQGEKRIATIGQPPDLGSYINNFTLKSTGTYQVLVQRVNIAQEGSYVLSFSESPLSETPTEGEVNCAARAKGLRSCGELSEGVSVAGYLAKGGYVRVSDRYLLGADSLGRDLFSRIIYGSRISLAVAFVGPLVSLIVGMFLGLISGYVGGQTDNLLMRFVDVMYAFPTILFIILMMAFFRASSAAGKTDGLIGALNKIDGQFGGMFFIFIGVGLTSWMRTARLTRAQVLSVRAKEYIEAAVSIGTTTPAIISRHVLPNILGPIIVAETLTIPTYISYEAFLSFIGLGVNRPTPSWGAMISDGSVAISSYPNQAIFPAVALFFIMFAFNFLGDGLRDALDPRTSKN